MNFWWVNYSLKHVIGQTKVFLNLDCTQVKEQKAVADKQIIKRRNR